MWPLSGKVAGARAAAVTVLGLNGKGRKKGAWPCWW